MKAKIEEEREYCPICESGERVDIPGVIWIVVYHTTCLEPIQKRETMVLEIMQGVARRNDILNAWITINAAIAGNSGKARG